jgi:NDP-sugar pyrophosphorylase family protein
MFTGVQIVEPSIFAHMEGGKPFSLTRATYTRLLATGHPLYGLDYSGFWQDLGTSERIRQVEEKLKSGTVRLHFL